MKTGISKANNTNANLQTDFRRGNLSGPERSKGIANQETVS